MQTVNRKKKSDRGVVLFVMLGVMFLISVAAAEYVQNSTQSYRNANSSVKEIQTTNLCEGGIQSILLNMWTPFKVNQNFLSMDPQCIGASVANPKNGVTGTIPGVGAYSAAVIGYSQPDNFDRVVTVRCVAWIDLNNNGILDPGEPFKTVDVQSTFSLQRSQVFDYTYFVNNYGWMDGFGINDLIVNGDMRSNGDFSFTNGSPTVNGSVYAANNQKLVPPAVGLVNEMPYKQTNSTYATAEALDTRMRQAYNSGTMGAYTSAQYKNWQGYVFDTNASIVNNQVNGAAIGDSRGIQQWQNTGSGGITSSMIDSTPTKEVVMPDLSNLSYYQNNSSSYVDTKQYYGDGTPNPNFGQGAFLQIWNSSLNAGLGGYQTVTTNGNYNGSIALIGSALHPIIVHGPITISQDAAIKGNVSGQGTIYTGRNVHIVGSIVYENPPNFQGSDPNAINNSNEKKDMLGLAARGSVIMGDVSQFTNSYPLQYMTPPFTHARYDDYGNLIPAYNATNHDSTGNMLYQSTLGNSYIHSIASSVNQIDAVLYTNFVGGGDIGTGGGGVKFNGSIISRDEAMVLFSLPMKMNYDSRIRERQITQQPLIDLNLPRSPVMLRSTWQDRGYNANTQAY